jgi:hypothetical protein
VRLPEQPRVGARHSGLTKLATNFATFASIPMANTSQKFERVSSAKGMNGFEYEIEERSQIPFASHWVIDSDGG